MISITDFELPNIKTLKDLFTAFERDFNLEEKTKRYKTNPELLEKAMNANFSEEDAIRALYAADFIVTTSEIPTGSLDDELYNSIFQSFLQGQKRCTSGEKLLRIIFLAYKVAVLIRRQDLYLGGRGLIRRTALIRLHDAFISPYLQIASEELGKGSCKWELGVLSAALKKEFAHLEFEKFSNAPVHTDVESLIPFTWKLLDEYSKVQSINRNDNVVLPYVEETNCLLVTNSRDKRTTSSDPRTLGYTFNLLKPLIENLDKWDKKSQIMFIRARSLETDERIILTRDPSLDTKPIVLFKTPATEINFTQILHILHMRGTENDAWFTVDSPKKKPKIKKEIPRPEEKKEEKKAEQEVKEVTTAKPEHQGAVSKFFKVLRGIFGGSKADTSETTVKKEKEVKEKPKPKLKPKKKPIVEKVVVPKISDHLSHALTVDAVGEVHLFDLFDTLRESKYNAKVIFESDFLKKETKFLQIDKTVDFSEIINILNEITNTLSKVTKILIEEVFFLSEGKKSLISLNGDFGEYDKRIVGIISQEYSIQEGVDWQEHKRLEEEDTSVARRTMLMRTNQILSARRRSQLDESVTRIFGDAVKNANWTDDVQGIKNPME